MLISGSIANVEVPNYTDQYQNQYQNIVISTATGPITGRIGCKKPYTGQDIGQQGRWDMEQATSSQGPYNKFKKHYDTPYQGGQQGGQAPQNAPQGTQRSAQGSNSNDMVRVRSMALAYAKDLVVADKISRDRLWEATLDFTAFVATGTTPPAQPLRHQTEPDAPEPDVVDDMAF